MKSNLLIVLAFLTGCSSNEVRQCPAPAAPLRVPYEVKVPVYSERKPPAELLRKYTPLDIPKFLKVDSPDAAVALDKTGVDQLKIILRTLKTRDDAWRAWATKPSGAK